MVKAPLGVWIGIFRIAVGLMFLTVYRHSIFSFSRPVLIRSLSMITIGDIENGIFMDNFSNTPAHSL